MTASPQEEWLDIVDHADRVVGRAPRAELYRRGLRCFRVVNAFIRNRRGKLWIPRRAATKRLFPLCLDASMGGHVTSGESYDEALRRELREELRIELEESHWRLLGPLTPQTDGTSAFMRVYEIERDMAPDFNRDDICEAFWLSPADLLDRIAAGERHKGDLPVIIRRLYLTAQGDR